MVEWAPHVSTSPSFATAERALDESWRHPALQYQSCRSPCHPRSIFNKPRRYHLKQVVLQERCESVQPLDPYKLPAGTTCYGAYLFYLEDDGLINVAVFGLCGVPTVKDPDVEDGARIELRATIQAPSHGGYYLSFEGLRKITRREGIIQAVADRITPLTD